MRICILSNFTKTYLYHRIAEELSRSGVETCWIAVNPRLYDFLLKHYPGSRVLLLTRDHFEGRGTPIDDFKLNEILYGDRVLRYEPEAGLRFLTNIQQPVYEFLLRNQVRAVFGEITWAHEILVHRMCSGLPELRCRFLNPHVVRIPNQRFAFFTDERQSQMLEVWRPGEWDGKVLEVRKPDYLKINDRRLKQANSLRGRLDRLRRFFTNENMHPKDPTLLVHSWWRLRSRAAEEWRKETYKRLRRTPFEEMEDRPFVFLGLHKQPEASVDVFGRYYEDQLRNIENLWRALPQDWLLLVKEHTNAIGDRPLRFYHRLQALPRVVLVDEHTNSYEMIRRARLVATITGTIAYEAALMGVPAVTFAPVFFNRLNSCRQISLEDLAARNLAELADELSRQPDNRAAFSEFLMRNSFAGNFLDPISAPAVLNEDNIRLLAQAMHIAVEEVAPRMPATESG